MMQSIQDVNSVIQSLNSQQKEVVYSNSRRLLCLAGPGTGKTHTLISRIAYSTSVLNIKPSSILALTFTNAAGNEMEIRYKQLSDDVNSPYFGTFHSFCYKLVCQDENVRKAIGYTKIPSIVDESKEKALQTQAIMLTGVKLPNSKLKISYEPTLREKFEFTLFQKQFEKLMVDENVITFDHLCFKICKLFKDKAEVILPYLSQYQYLYVDEFQDIDNVQFEFINAFSEHSNIMCIGDIRQNIYGFRGTSNEFIKQLSKDSTWKVVKLELNYRSTAQICNYANEFVKEYDDDISDIELVALKQGLEIQHIKTSEFLQAMATIPDSDYTSTAILARTNSEINKLKEKFDKLSIDYTSKVDDNHNKLILSALDDSIKRDYLLSLCNESDRAKYSRKIYLESNYDILRELEYRFKNEIDEIRKIQESDEFGQLQILYYNNDLNLKTIQPKLDSGLYLGTIHSVKGLEFNSVYVYGVNSNNFKIRYNEQMMNLYYVACTRAKDLLTIVEAD